MWALMQLDGTHSVVCVLCMHCVGRLFAHGEFDFARLSIWPKKLIFCFAIELMYTNNSHDFVVLDFLNVDVSP